MKTHVLLSLFALTGIAHAQTTPGVAPNNATEPAPFFRDVPRDHWAFAAVQRLANAGIIEGNSAAPAVAKTVAPKSVAAVRQSAVVMNVVKTKTALSANPALKGTLINVACLGQETLIVLTGTTKSEAQKQLAGTIARQNAPGFTLSNQLRVVR